MIILVRQSYINFSLDDALKYRKMFAGIRKKPKTNVWNSIITQSSSLLNHQHH